MAADPHPAIIISLAERYRRVTPIYSSTVSPSIFLFPFLLAVPPFQFFSPASCPSCPSFIFSAYSPSPLYHLLPNSMLSLLGLDGFDDNKDDI